MAKIKKTRYPRGYKVSKRDMGTIFKISCYSALVVILALVTGQAMPWNSLIYSLWLLTCMALGVLMKPFIAILVDKQ